MRDYTGGHNERASISGGISRCLGAGFFIIWHVLEMFLRAAEAE
jgi:hypothetical protein